jgi:hypothetical protein
MKFLELLFHFLKISDAVSYKIMWLILIVALGWAVIVRLMGGR